MSGSKPGVTGQIICAQSWVDTCNKVEVDFRFDTFCKKQTFLPFSPYFMIGDLANQS